MQFVSYFASKTFMMNLSQKFFVSDEHSVDIGFKSSIKAKSVDSFTVCKKTNVSCFAWVLYGDDIYMMVALELSKTLTIVLGIAILKRPF